MGSHVIDSVLSRSPDPWRDLDSDSRWYEEIQDEWSPKYFKLWTMIIAIRSLCPTDCTLSTSWVSNELNWLPIE